MWFRSVLAALGPARSVNRSHRGKKAAARRLGARRLLLEGLEDRHLLAFDVAVDYPAGNSPQAVITADFNSDGRLDVATANSGSSNMSVLLGNADGTFQAARTSATGVGPTTLLASDLNRDGQTDLVSMNLSDAYGSSGDLSVLLGNGDGTFQPPRTVVLPAQFPPGYTGASPVSQAPRFLALGDLDADGTLDLVAAGRTRYSTVIGYDEYGVPILADYYHMYVNVFPGIGNGSFATGVAQQVSIGSPSGLYLGDFDRDGRTDVVTGGGLHVSVLRGNGDGTLQDPQQSNVGWAWFTNISNPVADFDRDGNLDLLMRDGSGNFAVIMYGNGDGSFRRSSEVYLGTTINSAVVGDVNADDNLDIVVTNVNTEYGWCDDYDCYDPVSTRSAVALLGYGNGTFASPVTSDLGTVLAESGFSSVTLGDFDGNGLLDVAASDNFQNAVAVSLNDGVWAEPPPTIIINDVTVVEGNTGTTPAVFTVTLSAPWHQELTVDYATLTGHTDDIVATSGTLRFAPGQTSNTITVEVIGDSLVEVTEAFNVVLSNPTVGATIADSGYGRIIDDDKQVPELRISDVSVTEGNTGTRTATFTVTLSAASTETVTVTYATTDGTATEGSDYAAATGTLIIPAGQTTGTITVTVVGDRAPEPNEAFFVILGGATNAAIADAQGVGTITDDEPRVSITDVTKSEGKKNQKTRFTFTVTLSVAYDQPVTMSYRTVDGTATAGSGDYLARSGTLTFAPGETTKTITIEVKGDSNREADETFYLDLFGNSSNSLFTKNRGLGTILNDD